MEESEHIYRMGAVFFLSFGGVLPAMIDRHNYDNEYCNCISVIFASLAIGMMGISLDYFCPNLTNTVLNRPTTSYIIAVIITICMLMISSILPYEYMRYLNRKNTVAQGIGLKMYIHIGYAGVVIVTLILGIALLCLLVKDLRVNLIRRRKQRILEAASGDLIQWARHSEGIELFREIYIRKGNGLNYYLDAVEAYYFTIYTAFQYEKEVLECYFDQEDSKICKYCLGDFEDGDWVCMYPGATAAMHSRCFYSCLLSHDRNYYPLHDYYLPRNQLCNLISREEFNHGPIQNGRLLIAILSQPV